LKIIHFDSYPVEKKYQKKSSHVYFQEDIQTFLSANGPFEADIVTGFVYSKFDSKILNSIQNLKLVVTRSIGIDNIDTDFCDSKGIKYTNVEYSNHNVAHHTLALILYYSRQLNTFFTKIKKGNFSDKTVNCYDLKGKKLGIIGYGRIGKQVAQLAESFGLEILAYDRNLTTCEVRDNTRFCGLEGVLQNSDIISLHCDANPTSIGMINNETIKMMKDGVILINTARGSIINEKDLLRNINKFSFVGLDVLEDENNFKKSHPFLKHPNLFITPHIAYKSEMTSKERWKQTYKHIDEFISQQKL
jgi:phosphoglycerate dehydrogenase-like enzyme